MRSVRAARAVHTKVSMHFRMPLPLDLACRSYIHGWSVRHPLRKDGDIVCTGSHGANTHTADSSSCSSSGRRLPSSQRVANPRASPFSAARCTGGGPYSGPIRRSKLCCSCARSCRFHSPSSAAGCLASGPSGACAGASPSASGGSKQPTGEPRFAFADALTLQCKIV